MLFTCFGTMLSHAVNARQGVHTDGNRYQHRVKHTYTMSNVEYEIDGTLSIKVQVGVSHLNCSLTSWFVRMVRVNWYSQRIN